MAAFETLQKEGDSPAPDIWDCPVVAVRGHIDDLLRSTHSVNTGNRQSGHHTDLMGHMGCISETRGSGL